MTIAEIQTLENEAKVPPFTVKLDFINEPRGKVQTCKASDETGSIKLTLISRPPVSAALKGKTLTVVGGIYSIDTWNGVQTPQVKLLPKGSFDVQGSENPPQKPQGSVSAAPAAQPHVNGYSHSNGNGQRAGMCTKAAVDILIAAYNKGDVSFTDLGKPEFGLSLYRLASDISRVSERLEKGELAPAAKDRAELTVGEDKVIKAATELFTGEAE